MLNKHGLPMRGIKEATRETHYTDCGLYTGIYYNIETGRIYAYSEVGCNTWHVWEYDPVIPICNVNHRMTMQQIADRIADVVNGVWYRVDRTDHA